MSVWFVTGASRGFGVEIVEIELAQVTSRTSPA
jgi:NAD(P)-dependent dehydrogenase (short-subunit alcohol dehydrogenase family)